jgi:hypothetical protein
MGRKNGSLEKVNQIEIEDLRRQGRQVVDLRGVPNIMRDTSKS